MCFLYKRKTLSRVYSLNKSITVVAAVITHNADEFALLEVGLNSFLLNKE